MRDVVLVCVEISVFGNFPDNDGAVYYNITKKNTCCNEYSLGLFQPQVNSRPVTPRIFPRTIHGRIQTGDFLKRIMDSQFQRCTLRKLQKFRIVSVGCSGPTDGSPLTKSLNSSVPRLVVGRKILQVQLN